MKIEVWTDFICPFCYIGKRQLELALEQFLFKEHVIIEYKSFQVYSTENDTQKKHLKDILNERFSIDQEVITQLMVRAKEVGLSYELDKLLHENTFDAHRFMKYACTQNKSNEVTDRLLKGYFLNNEEIATYDVLMKICEELSFDKDEVDSFLKTKKYTRAVKLDQLEAEEIGINQIPFFLFNEEIALSGVQSVDIFMAALEEVWHDMGSKPHFSKRRKEQSSTTYCEGNNCKNKKE